ncbi:MAG: BMP family ABC transporter substrate-binding protein [Synergistaceae bacterium]|nr:BMP family ABC transporter substrate-binding protein [Synergistaceae bacterium]
MRKFVYCLLLLACISFITASASFAAPKRIALMLAGSAGDNAYSLNDACIKGLNEVQDRYKKKIASKVYNTYKTRDNLRLMLEKAAGESDLIIIPEPAYYEYMPVILVKYPDVKFVVFDKVNIPGVKEVLFRDEEGGFLAGALAAAMTKREGSSRINPDGKIAILLGRDTLSARRFLKGYIAGAWYIDPGVEVLHDYTKDFGDFGRARDLAMKFREQGADVIFTAAGAAGTGAINEAATSGYWVIGSDTEQEELFPDAVLTSIVKLSDSVMYSIVEKYINGDLEENEISLGIAEKCIDISIWTRTAKTNVPPDVRNKIEEIRDKIARKLIIIR